MNKQCLQSSSSLRNLRPFLHSDQLLRVSGRESESELSYQKKYPPIIHNKHQITKLIIHSEHLCTSHAGPILLSATLSNEFHIVYMKKSVCEVVRKCKTCCRQTAKPQPQLLGQLPIERVSPGFVFQKVGVDYARPIKVKYGMVCKPTVVKAYICIFVSLSINTVHLEAASDLTSEAFIATLRRFIARRGYPNLIWSDHGSNFVGDDREIREFHEFLKQQKTKRDISEFCTASNLEWRFIPEHGPHFGGLWEAAVKSTKFHLKRIVGCVKSHLRRIEYCSCSDRGLPKQ